MMDDIIVIECQLSSSSHFTQISLIIVTNQMDANSVLSIPFAVDVNPGPRAQKKTEVAITNEIALFFLEVCASQWLRTSALRTRHIINTHKSREESLFFHTIIIFIIKNTIIRQITKPSRRHHHHHRTDHRRLVEATTALSMMTKVMMSVGVVSKDGSFLNGEKVQVVERRGGAKQLLRYHRVSLGCLFL